MRASRLAASLALLLLAAVAGCRSSEPAPPASPPPAGSPPAPDLDAELARARAAGIPLLLVVTEPGRSAADDAAHELAHDPGIRRWTDQRVGGYPQRERAIVLDLDLGVSKNRATAMRYHLGETPYFVTLSSRGVVVHRGVSPFQAAELRVALYEAETGEGPALDRKLDELEAAALTHPDDPAAHLAVADFLIARGNLREPVPHLAAVVHTTADFPLEKRIAAWAELARCHFRAHEVEKGRAAARELISTLGPTSPDARAAGAWVQAEREIEYAHPKPALALLDEAIAASPDSIWGKRAAEARAKLAR